MILRCCIFAQLELVGRLKALDSDNSKTLEKYCRC
jgi:hypothetical protein